MCTHYEAVGRLIETDVTVSSDAEKLEIDSAGSCDSRIVFLTFNLNVLCETVRDMGVFLFDVDAVEEIVLHEITVALVVFGRERIVFVKVVALYILEIDFAVFIHFDELFVKTDGRRAGCKTENAVGLLVDLSGDDLSRLHAEGIVILADNKNDIIVFAVCEISEIGHFQISSFLYDTYIIARQSPFFKTFR